MRRLPALPIPWLACALVACVAAGQAARAEEQSVLVDEAYCFRLERPAPGWRLLNRDEVHKVVPDALAGLVGPTGVWGAVIGEQAPATDLDSFARLLLDNMPLEEKKVERREMITFQGRPALQLRVSGRVSGIEAVFVNTLFANGDYMFQVLAWAPRPKATADFHEPVVRAFTVLPGEVTGRADVARAPDAGGVGWRLRDGRFESAATGIAVDPPGRWRAAVGDELLRMNEAAEVGLVHVTPDVYLVLITESTGGADREAFRRTVMETWGEAETPRPVGKPVAAKVAGRAMALHPFELAGQPQLRFLKGVVFHGDLCVQVLAWHVTALAPQVEPLLREACASIRFLDEGAVRTLTAELEQEPDPDEVVGLDFVLRRGLYRDFRYDFSVSRPRGQFWRFRVGQDARSENPDARLTFWHPALGLSGVVIAEEMEDTTDAQFHAWAVGSLFGEEHPATKKGAGARALPGAPGLGTAGVLVEDGLSLTYRLHTLVRHGCAYQVLVSGFPAVMRSAKGLVDDLVRAVEVHADLEPELHEDGQFTDVRMGYAMRLPAAWKRSEMRVPGVEAVSSFRQWRGKGDMILVLSVCALRSGQDAAWFGQLVDRIIGSRFRDKDGVETGRTEDTLGGIPCMRRTWRFGVRRMVLFLLTRNRTHHAVFVAQEDGRTEATIQVLRTAFRFVD